MKAFDKLRVVLGVLLIGLAVILTLKYGLKGSPIFKIAILALDALIVYYAINRMIKRKK